MARVVRCGLIQASCEWSPEKFSLAQIKQKMMAKHEQLIANAAKKKVQILGLQELFYGPYFCAEQQTRECVRRAWDQSFASEVPDTCSQDIAAPW